MADPKSYLDRYTNLSFVSPVDNSKISVPITAYGSGWGDRDGGKGPQGPDCQGECGIFRRAVNKAYNDNPNKASGSSFQFDKRPLANIDKGESFSESSFIKAFLGKGSPDDIAATLRIGLAVGRIGMGADPNGMHAAAATPGQYVSKFISLDCNAFVGNYLGTDTETRPRSYAVATRCRQNVADVRPGDLAVTFTTDGKAEHIAMIQEWSPAGAGTTPNSTRCMITIVEWGEAGDESKHYYGPTAHDARKGPNNAYQDKFPGIYFMTDTNKIRYVFAPS
jgi:hypothetical protein